jgi:hypothetical protein
VHVVTIVTTIAIVENVTQHLDVSRRTSVSEIAIQATMRNSALRRPHPARHQLPVLPLRRRQLRQLTSPARTQELKWKLAVTTAMMTAIAADATRSQGACLQILAWELATVVATQSGVAKRHLLPLQLRQCHLQHRHPLGQRQTQGSRGTAKMLSFMVSEQLAQSTCCVAWACNAS